MVAQLNDELFEWVRTRHFGKYRGTVVDNNDPTGRGRLKVTVPAVLGDLAVWAMPCLPFAGDNQGQYMMAEPGSGVFCEFEGGDTSFCIYAGFFYADNELPKNEKGQSATPTLKIIRTKTGLMATFDDDGQTISISDENGQNILTIEVQPGKIRIKGASKAVVEAPQIELVENANHPIVFGDNLLQYLNQIVQIYTSHLHPGQMLGQVPITPAPPVPPMPAATQSLLSTRVKAG